MKLKKLLFVSLLLVGLTGCGGGYGLRQFYVASTSEGYVVALDKCFPSGTVHVSRAFVNPVDATVLAQKLNRDMAEDWSK